MTTRYKKLVLLSLLGFIAPPSYAETETTQKLNIDIITKKWKCKYCPDLSDEEEQWDIKLDLGLGYVSNSSYKFGEYNTLVEDGVYLDAGVNAYYRDDEANFWNIEADNLGLKNSRFDVEGGKQGTYSIKLEVDNISKHNLDTSRTPYIDGGSNQTLPGGWTQGANTGALTDLNSSLRDVNFSTKRRNFILGGEYITSGAWSYEAWFKRKTKEGNLPTSFGFGFNQVANLSQPVDYTTDDVELKANYRYAGFNGQIAFINSTFKNGFDRFEWDNAYNGTASDGQAGVAPDNSKQQILLSGNYLGIEDWQLNAMFSVARLEQNETFLPYTVNAGLVTSALPATSLNGEVYVYTSNLAAHWQASEKNRWHFIYEYHNHDNQTTRNTYTYVTADNTVTGTPRANAPYSFLQSKFKLNTDYKFDTAVTLTGGLQYAKLDRTYQSVETTEENMLWGKLHHRIDNDLQYSFKLDYSERSIDNYNVLTELTPPANPNMRKFNMADRDGLKAGFNLSASVSDAFLLNFSTDLAGYDYDESTVGLTSSDEFSIGLDAQYTVDEDLSFSAFIQDTDIDSQQAGTTWTADTNDNVITAGLGMNYQIIEDKFSVGLDVVHADSSSAIDISGGGTPFPELTTQRDTITLSGNYLYDENLTIKATYQYESYDEDNWYIENVDPDTLTNVLALGDRPPSYDIGVLWLSVQYTF